MLNESTNPSYLIDNERERAAVLAKIKVEGLFRAFPDNLDNYSAILKYVRERMDVLEQFRRSNEFKTIKNYRINYYAEVNSLNMFLNYTLERFRRNKARNNYEAEIVNRIVFLVRAFDEIVKRNMSKRAAKVLIPARPTEVLDPFPRIMAKNWRAGWPKRRK